ncbi:MAG: glycosyltransferase family 4 protein [bacterium]
MSINKILINGTAMTSGMDGINRFTNEILNEIDITTEEVYVLTSLIKTNLNNLKTIAAPKLLNEYGSVSSIFRLIWNQIRTPKIIKENNINLYYSPNPEGMLNPRCPQIITVHDIIPILYPNSNPRLKYYYRYVLPNLLKVSDFIIVPSKSTKEDLIRYYYLDSSKIKIVYQGYKKEIFSILDRDVINKVLSKYKIKNKYILCVGETRPYKNITKLIKAIREVKVKDIELIVVGKINRLDKNLLKLPQELGISDRIKFLGFVPDEDLAALYNGANTFVFPSLYEGFGIPPLEALACGCPVIASDRASIPEVCGNAAIYINPNDEKDIARKIDNVCADAKIRQKMKSKGLLLSKKYSYENAAKDLIQIFKETLG